MTDHAVRLYALALSLLVLFVSWAAVAARPWAQSATPDPRLAAVAEREQRLRHESVVVQVEVARRWEAYRVALVRRQRDRAALASRPVQPAVRVVTLPPLTVTRSS